MDAMIRRSEATRSCTCCGVRFTSRKRYSKHDCTPVPEVEQPAKPPTSEAKRARRAKARLAAKLKRREARARAQVTSGSPPVAENKLTPTPPGNWDLGG